MTTMTTAVSTKTPEVPAPFFQEAKEALFNQTQKSFETCYPQWEGECDSLEQFEIDVRLRGSDLQHEKAKPPKKGELDAERDGFLQKYWDFKGTCDKMALCCSELSKMIAFLTPQPRSYYEEERLKSEQPELLDQIKKHEEICKTYVGKLQQFSQKTNALKDRFVNCITVKTNNVNWSLQRFCQIVDNGGKPISGWTRLVDNVKAPVIPKPKGASAVLSTSSSALNKEAEKNSSTSGASASQQKDSSPEKKNESSSTQAPTLQPQVQSSAQATNANKTSDSSALAQQEETVNISTAISSEKGAPGPNTASPKPTEVPVTANVTESAKTSSAAKDLSQNDSNSTGVIYDKGRNQQKPSFVTMDVKGGGGKNTG